MPAIVISAPISSNHAAPVSAGGTGATTAAAARTNLDVYSKSEVTNAISQSTAWYTSNTSFTAAATAAGITRTHLGEALDAIASGISSQTDGTIVNKVQYTNGPAIYVTVGKTNSNYFAGTAWSYYDQKYFVEFIYSNGSYQIKFM